MTLTVDLVSVETGTLLAAIPPVQGAPGDADLLADAMAGRLASIVAVAPGVGGSRGPSGLKGTKP